MKIHFSIDDVLKSFCWLERTNATSIYESFVFSTLKDIHMRYNIPIDVYCMYQIGESSICEVSDRWRTEFEEAGKWLNFGFHAYKEDSNYNNASAKEVERQYKLVEKEIKRITGCKELADTVRLHYFSGNENVTLKLRELGVKALLCADDDRVSYGISQNVLKECGEWYDPKSDMIFLRTDFRVENTLELDVESVLKKAQNNEHIIFFTHEPLLRDEKILKRIYEILDMIEGDGRNVY